MLEPGLNGLILNLAGSTMHLYFFLAKPDVNRLVY